MPNGSFSFSRCISNIILPFSTLGCSFSLYSVR